MSLIWVDLQLGLLAAHFANRLDHSFRTFSRYDLVLTAHESVNRNLGQVFGPLVKLFGYVFGSSPPDAAGDRCDSGKMLRGICGPDPCPVPPMLLPVR